MSTAEQIIESAFERRAEINAANVTAEVKDAVLDTIELLDAGTARHGLPKNQTGNGW